MTEMNELETSIQSHDLPTTSRQGRATGGRNLLTVVTGVTIDELVEIVTWRQLGLHDKSVLVLDAAGWAQPFIALVEALIAGGFVAPEGRGLFTVVPDVAAAMALLRRTEAGDAAPSDPL